jgi:predicted transcriptional regulator
MNTNQAIRIGIMSQEKIRERMLNIARGSHEPMKNEPKIWFTSMRSLAEVLSDENRALLRIIKNTQPNSIKELSDTTGREPSNLSRTLKTLSNYGIVELIKESKQVKPIAKSVKFEILAA